MKVHELIKVLQTFPVNIDVYLATEKHETVSLCDVRDENSRGERILLLSSRGVWYVPKQKQCSSPPTPSS